MNWHKIQQIENPLGFTFFTNISPLLGILSFSQLYWFDILVGRYFTVFVPSEAAFQKLPPGLVDQLMKNKTFLMDTLTFHIVRVQFTVLVCLPAKESQKLPLGSLCKLIPFLDISSNDHSFSCLIINTDTIHKAILFIDTPTMLHTIKFILIGKAYLTIIATNEALWVS